jgi:hypothetical protein
MLLAITAGVVVAAVITVVIIVAWIVRYLHASVGEYLRLVAIAEAMMLVGLAVGLFLSRALLATVAAWSDQAGSPARAVATWPAVERGPFLVVSRVCLAILVAECIVTLPLAVTDLGLQAYVWGLLVIVIATAVGAAGLFVIFGIDLSFRPMLVDVASHLPAEFAPTTRSWRLPTKAIAPLPAVTLFTALTVGAFSDAARNGSHRLALVIGVSLVAVAVATVILAVVTRSALDPLDELTAATRRVREGDLTRDAMLLTTDDLRPTAGRGDPLPACDARSLPHRPLTRLPHGRSRPTGHRSKRPAPRQRRVC